MKQRERVRAALRGEAIDRPVRFEEIHATLYNRLGIDPLVNTVNDLSGRPQYLTEHHQPLPELI